MRTFPANFGHLFQLVFHGRIRFFSFLILSFLLANPFLSIISIPANAQSLEQNPYPTQTPTPIPSDNGKSIFGAGSDLPDQNWRPPLFKAPLALNLHDHFYFERPIALDSNNWPLADYRYGYIYPDEDVVHTGVDIVSPLHKPVLAAGAGKVVFAGYGLLNGAGDKNDPYGLAVMIRHSFSFSGYTIFSVYAHLDRIDVINGDNIKAGDPIGIIGLTGKTSGPHLHFEIRLENKDGDKVQNPELWVVPALGDGIIAGRIENDYGTLIPAKEFWLSTLDKSQKWKLMTYSSKTKQVDDYYQENFAIGDIPAGKYDISINYFGKVYHGEVTITPGAVNYIQFNGRHGFAQELPASSSGEEFFR
ncbi:MAG: M23 family metallopeptidase [Chloroflexi bacterium]|nr:M23 family metallopeptidase [Chloroflexota bacterium]